MSVWTRLRGDPSLTRSERRALVSAMYRDPRVLVPWSLFTGGAIVLVPARGGDTPGVALALGVVIAAGLCALCMTVVNRVLDRDR